MNADSPNNQTDYELHLQFAAPSERLFSALSTIAGTKEWWTKSSDGDMNVGDLSSFHFPPVEFFAVMKTLQRDAPRLLEWECVDSRHAESTGYDDLRDWVGTRIRFAIRDLDNGKSQLDFTHSRLKELECTTVCSSGWSFFLNESLRGYLETGKGQPAGQSDMR